MPSEGDLPRSLDIDQDRARLYALCEEMGVGITVMKALGAGRLLRAESSPLMVPMTVHPLRAEASGSEQRAHRCAVSGGD